MRQVHERGEGQTRAAATGVQRPVDQKILDHAHLPQAGDGQSEADGEAAGDDVGLLDHAPGGGIGRIVNGGAPCARVDAGLVRRIGLQPAVPVEVVGREVEAGRGERAERAGGVELEAGELDGHDVGPVLQNRGDGGRPDVADGRGIETGGAQNGREHADRRGLAVGSRHDDPRDVGTSGLLEAPGELDLAPHLTTARPCACQDRAGRRHPRGDDDQVGTGLVQRVGLNPAVPDGHPLQRRRHGIGGPGAGVEQMDARPEIVQGVDDGEPGTTGADDADARPGEVLQGHGVGGGHCGLDPGMRLVS